MLGKPEVGDCSLEVVLYFFHVHIESVVVIEIDESIRFVNKRQTVVDAINCLAGLLFFNLIDTWEPMDRQGILLKRKYIEPPL